MTMTLNEPDSTVRAEVLGEELRRLREASGLTLAEVAARIGISVSHLSRLETGKRAQSVEDVAALLVVYEVTGEERLDLIALAKKSRQPGLWQQPTQSFRSRVTALALLESRATSLVDYEPLVIPGLLQTVPYAEAIFRGSGGFTDPEELSVRVAGRIHRQGVLRKRNAPRLLVMILESALRTPVGGRQVLRDQLRYLVEAAERPNIDLRIIPTAVGAHPGLDGGFIRLRFPGRRAVVFVGAGTSSLFLEDPFEVGLHDRRIERLQHVAMTPPNSVRLVAELAASME